MKILVFSDSHGDGVLMSAAMKREKPDAVCHCGDHYFDCRMIADAGVPVYSVCGNCEMPGDAPGYLELELGGKRIFMTHGHLYRVKSGLDAVINNAMLRNADILLFGHTHIQYLRESEGLYIMNPGSAMSGMYGVVTIENGEISCRLRHL